MKPPELRARRHKAPTPRRAAAKQPRLAAPLSPFLQVVFLPLPVILETRQTTDTGPVDVDKFEFVRD